MATSGNLDWTLTRNEIINRALRLIGTVAQGETPAAEEITEAATALNSLIKSWQAENIHLWKIAWRTQTLTASEEVTGTDSEVYTCIRGHTSSIDDKPITGANYTTYWKQTGSTGGTWATATDYTSIGDVELINSVTDSIALNSTANTITKTGQMYRFTAGRTITLTSAEDSANDGTYTISSVTDDVITTDESITTTNADDDTVIVKEKVSDILGITEAFVRNNGTTDTPLQIISRQEYFEIADKTTTGLPNKIWFENLIIPKIHLWPPADSTDYVIHYSAITRLEDFDTGTDDPDFDAKWIEALAFNLAYKLSFEYGLSIQERSALKIEATELKNTAKTDSNEYLGMHVMPDLRSR